MSIGGISYHIFKKKRRNPIPTKNVLRAHQGRMPSHGPYQKRSDIVAIKLNKKHFDDHDRPDDCTATKMIQFHMRILQKILHFYNFSFC